MSDAVPWYRSWPMNVPSSRAYVADDLPRIPIRQADFGSSDEVRKIAARGLGFINVEWDIAFSLSDRINFARYVAQNPKFVCVAPYILYHATTGLRYAVWAHRVGPERESRWLRTDEPYADLVGFGMIYFPPDVLNAFLRTPQRAEVTYFTDTQFSLWHYSAVGRRIPVLWDIKPVHLHY